MTSYPDFLPTVRFQETLAISPDGHEVAYVDDALGQFNLVVQPIAGGEPRRLTSYVDSTVKRVCWHPDGRSLIFLADSKGDENSQVFQMDAGGGDPQPLTDASKAQYVAALGDPFSPDGKLFAYAGNDLVAERQDVLVRHLETGAVHRLYDGGGRVFPGHWSPDGTQLTIADWRVGTSDHVVFVAPIGPGPVRRVSPHNVTAAFWLGPWLPDGSGFYVLSDASRDLYSLGIINVDTTELTWLVTSEWEVEDFALSGDGRLLVWVVNVDGSSQLRGRDLASGTDILLPELPAGSQSCLTVSLDGRYAAMLLSTATRPTNVVVLDLTTGDHRWLTNAAPCRADAAQFVEPTIVHFPAHDGRSIPGLLYQPNQSSGQTGVVLAIHGGPSRQERPTYTHDGFFQYLISQGLAVFAPNIRGSSGYGMSYEKLSYRDWGGGDLRDLAEAATFLKAQEWVDPARIGLVGRSYGGFAVLSCIARLPETGWAAAVDWCGPSNLVTFTRSQPPTWRSKVSAMVGDPDADHEFLLSRSPVTYVDQVRTPVMVIQGANDPRVPRHESDQIVRRLGDRGVEVRYDVYEDEGHAFGKRANQIKAWSAAGEFLLSHLA